MNYAEFVSRPKSMVIAPAGHGKTHAIAMCLKHTEGKQLILTHTHAGVASLKEKMIREGIKNNQYNVETIDSFAQKYVHAFYCGNDIPEQEDCNSYYPFIIEKATQLFKITPILDVIRATYSGVFVDEYQDCTIAQHNLVKALASTLPTRILGDDLQGIFDFAGPLVDFDKDLKEFEKFPDLHEPWRWKKTNPDLGNVLKEIRVKLNKRENVDLNLYEPLIEVLLDNHNKRIWNLSNEDSVLVLHPNSSKKSDRENFIVKFNYSFRLVEAIDDKTFYFLARELDKFKTIENVFQELIVFLKGRQVKTGQRKTRKNTLLKGLSRYFPDDTVLPTSRKTELDPIINNIKELEQKKNYSLLAQILREIKRLSGVNCTRTELFYDLCKALEQADYKGISVFESMKEIRNIKRRMGRKVQGRCIGTTLLTKGLEFDTVAVLDAHNFNCPKNFYVAITRARKKLIIFTNDKILSPYQTC